MPLLAEAAKSLYSHNLLGLWGLIGPQTPRVVPFPSL